MYGSAVAKVADDSDFEPVDFSLFLLNSVQVNEGLRGVLFCAAASIDDGDFGEFCRELSRALQRVPKRDYVCVVFDGANGVGEVFTFFDACAFSVREADAVSS